LPSSANFPGIFELAVAFRYAADDNRGLMLRFSRAMPLTSLMRSAICSRVKPSGKMIFRVGGAATVVGFGAGSSRRPPTASVMSQSAMASPASSKPSAIPRRTSSWVREGR
jgi:hypothetical protein